MSYTDLYLRRSTPKPLIVTVAVVAGVMISVFFLGRSLRPQPSKASQISIDSVMVANISHSSASVFWQTTDTQTGWVLYGETENDLTHVAQDLRDVGEKKGTYTNHIAELDNLKPLTKYFYQIIVDNKIVSVGGKTTFNFSTVNKIDVLNQYEPLYGKAVYTTGKAAENAVVIVKSQNLYPLITLTKITGEWLLPLHQAVDTVTNKQKVFTDTDILNITIVDESKTKATIQTLLKNASPLPQTLVIGNSYNFTQSDSVLGTQTVNTTESKTTAFDVLYPQEGAVIAGGRPLIRGTGAVNQKIVVTVNRKRSSLNYSYVATVDKKGSWTANVTSDLSAGEYTLKVSVSGVANEFIARNFTITKVGQQVLGESTSATPSATIAPTISAAPTTTTVPPTLAPTVPFASITPIPTIIRTGHSFVTLAVTSAALLVIGLGILLIF